MWLQCQCPENWKCPQIRKNKTEECMERQCLMSRALSRGMTISGQALLLKSGHCYCAAMLWKSKETKGNLVISFPTFCHQFHMSI